MSLRKINLIPITFKKPLARTTSRGNTATPTVSSKETKKI